MSTLELEIGRAPPDAWPQCAELLSAHLPDGVREEQRLALERLLAAHPEASRHLWVARRGPLLVAAILGQPCEGRVAVAYPPQLIAGEPPTTAGLLHERLLEDLVEQQVELVQVSLHPQDESSSRWLERHGYHYIADLLYLLANVPDEPLPPRPGELEFVACTNADSERLVNIVEATYVATRDCPRMDGWRDVRDVLAGYRATGTYDPSHWLIARHQNRDVGCLLLTEHAEFGHWELLYMGLAQEYRGRGWGRELVQQAVRQVQAAGRQQLVLAVDRQNEPALRVYRGANFVPWGRRRVLAQRLATPFSSAITTSSDPQLLLVGDSASG